MTFAQKHQLDFVIEGISDQQSAQKFAGNPIILAVEEIIGEQGQKNLIRKMTASNLLNNISTKFEVFCMHSGTVMNIVMRELIYLKNRVK